MANKVWFITGSSKGFGRIWAEAALERGDRVAATARDAGTLAPLSERYGDAVLALTLNVDDRAACFAAVAKAQQHFGQIDVAINNAGYGHFGAIEEVTEAEARAQIETNVFGALWVTQAVLPHMRERRAGHIIQVSSIGGVNAFPTLGLYHASKWALEGFSSSLAAEVAEFGIKVTLVEPGPYATDWSSASAVRSKPLPAYDGIREARAAARKGWRPGDPAATGPAILKLVDAAEPPLRVFFGDNGLPMTKAEYERRLALWEQWNGLAIEAQGNLAAQT